MTHPVDAESELSPLKRALLAIQDLTAKLDAAERARHEPIAVVGMACRFPGGANDPDRYWELLAAGRDGVGEVPPDRWDADAYYDPDPDAVGRMYTRAGGFLDHPVDRFDAGFFGISPREAEAMDPQQRLLLELSWEALEHAGIAPDRLAGSRTGVFVGISSGDYALRQQHAGGTDGLDVYSGTGSAFSIAAGRISYLLGVHGPCLALDTACSSSLVAVHLAVQSLRDRRADAALAGGVNLLLAPESTVAMCRLRLLSREGRCRTFDAGADGYVRGEGCGVVVLKRLSDAVADGDRVLAVIRGTAVNHDGRSSGLTVPNAAAQQAVMREALADARVAPHELDYVEAQGTGTALGDPIELRAIAAVYGAGRTSAEPVLVGSVKTNLGHLEAASGVAGLIKTVLGLGRELIPPHLHLETPTPHIDWDALPLRVPTRAQPWPRGARPRFAAVSAFAVSGTNAHVILEEAPLPAAPSAARDEGDEGDAPFLLPLSAKSDAALRALAGRYAEFLARCGDAEVGDVCFTAATGRAHFEHRAVVAGRGAVEIAAALRDVAHGRPVARQPAGPLAALAERYLAGESVDWGTRYPAALHRRVTLPTYAFQRERYWVDGAARPPAPSAPSASASSNGAAPPALRQRLAQTPDLDARRRLLSGFLQACLARSLRLDDASSLAPERPLAALGVDSLMAVELRNAVEHELGVELDAAEIFDAPTLVDLAARIAGALAETPARDTDSLAPVPRDRPLPLSFAQQRLWFLHQMEPAGTAYNITVRLQLRGALDVGALERSLDEIQRRHESLRTVFREIDGEPRQVILAAPPARLETIRLDTLPDDEREAAVERIVRAEAAHVFDLATGPLARFHLLRLGEEEHLLVLAMHHVVTDGWSLGVLARELQALYTAFSTGRDSPLPELELQYADYAVWQREHLGAEAIESQLAYWRAQLAGLPTLELPLARPRPPVQTHHSALLALELSPELSEAVRRLGRGEGVTLFMTLLAAFELLLARWSGQADFAIGAPIAGRTRRELEGLIGFFVNNLVLRADLSGDPTFRELLARVRETTLGAYAHQDVPFERLVEALNPPRDLSRTPFFQVMFNLLPSTALERQQWDGVVAKVVDATNADAEAKYDLTLFAVEGERIRVRFVYNTDLFDEITIARLADGYRTLLAAAVERPDERAARLPLLPPAERQRMLVEWNAERLEVPTDATLPALFEAQVARTPDAPSLDFEGTTLTYSELDRRANRLARHLQGLGVGPETRVALVLERSVELVVAILGTLKAGGAWVPIEPDYPAERVRWMLDDSAAPVLLTHSRLAARLPHVDARVVCLDAEVAAIEAHEDTAPPRSLTPAHLAYVIYTSGSTGRPKGVMIEHRGVCSRLLWQRDAYAIDGSDVFLHKTPIGFDVSVWEMLVPLVSGARLVVARPGGHRDMDYLVRTIEARRVTAVQFVPSVLRLFLEVLRPGACATLRHVFAGGEALPADLAREFLGRHNARLHNLYGPTETSGAVTRWTIERDQPFERVPIGRPAANTRVYVLDAADQPVPVGVAGELCVGGVQVGRGYLDRPDLTAERFVPDSFGGDPAGRLYRTGDRARWLPDGTLEYLGRTDDQVKLRGVRIEPGELEAVLRSYPGVGDAVVVARAADGQPIRGGVAEQLVAFVVTASRLETNALRARLADLLPPAMLPSEILPVGAIPLTPNGKVDRQALLEMVPAEPDRAGFVAPTTPLEQLLAGLWQELLEVERVGVHDNFYDLGGHSLLAMRFIARLEDATGIRINPRELTYQTLGQLAATHAGDVAVALSPATVPGLIGRLRRGFGRAVSRGNGR